MPQKASATFADNAAKTSEKILDAMKKYKMPNMDIDAAMDMCRKNMDTLTQTQKASMEMINNISKMQGSFSREIIDDMINHFKSITAAKSLEERSQMQTQQMQNQMDKMMNHGRAVKDVWSKSCIHIGDRLKDCFKENVKEAKSMMEKAQKQQN